MNINDLNVKIFYPQAIPQQEVKDFNRVFDLWYKVWVETREEVDSTLSAPSDSFSRQDEIVVLYHKDVPIGLECHRYVDTSQNWVTKDSYFMPKLWSEELKTKFLNLGRWQILGSHIFIDQNYRKNASGLSTKNILCSIALNHSYATSADALVGMMRKDRGLSKLFYEMGAICLQADVAWYQIPVDITAFLIKKNTLKIDSAYLPYLEMARSSCPSYEKDVVIQQIRKGEVINEYSRSVSRQYKEAV